MISVNSPNSSARIRGGNTRHKPSSATRSLSRDDRKYIEQLEVELSTVQNELPSVAQDHALKMSRITAENKELQAQIKDWEMRYDEEMRDFVQQHNIVERTLRSKNTSLEDYATRAKDRVVELELQLQKMQMALEGAEAANVQLEKRIEIMSELLTSSSSRNEPFSDAPVRRRMQSRPRSMLPRIPNNRGSWIGSPERTPEFGALSSPTLTFAQPQDAISEAFEPLERIVSREVWSSSPQVPSEADTDYRPPSSRSTTGTDHARDQEHQQNHARARPARRMRRFAPGSNGPKPLILPYASQVDQSSMTAPPLDRHESTPSLPFRRTSQFEILDSPLMSRPRATTAASENALGFTDTSSSRDIGEAGFQRMLSLARNTSDNRPYSVMSAGSDTGPVSRNLLDELHALKYADADDRSTVEGSLDESMPLISDLELPANSHLFLSNNIQAVSSSSRLTTQSPRSRQWQAESMELSMMQRDDAFNPALESMMGPLRRSTPGSDDTPKAVLQRKRSTSMQSETAVNLAGLSALDRLRSIFGDLLHSPADVARMIVHVTQQRMHVPEQLLRVQWWVVGLLWGPMARRRMIQHPHTDISFHPERPELMRSRTPSLALNESLAYGTLYSSPSSSIRRRAIAGPGKKRTLNTKHCTKENESVLSKHNPLLWVKFSLTLAFAVGKAFTSGPGSLMPGSQCPCQCCKDAEQ